MNAKSSNNMLAQEENNDSAKQPLSINSNFKGEHNATRIIKTRFFQKRKYIFVIVMVLMMIITGFIFHLISQKQKEVMRPISTSVQTSKTTPTSPSASIPTTTSPPIKPIDPNAWEIISPKEERLATLRLKENILIYAVKDEYKSSVYKKDLNKGNQVTLFEFIEEKKAEKSGNLWKGLPPNIALSPNRQQVLFIDNEGLKTFSLKTADVETFISKIEKTIEDRKQPKWSENALYAYSLARPKWSSDGDYVSFLQSHYEGATLGVFNITKKEYKQLKLGGGYSNLVWGPTGHALAKASGGAYEGMGLFYTSGNLEEIEDLSEKFGEESSAFRDASFSPSGKQILFVFWERTTSRSSENNKIGLVNTDGNDFLLIEDSGINETPFFSSDSNSIFYIQKRGDTQVLMKYDLTTGKTLDYAVLPKEMSSWHDVSWTKEGYLLITGTYSKSPLYLGGDRTRLYILDMLDKKVIYASPIYEKFTIFSGLTT